MITLNLVGIELDCLQHLAVKLKNKLGGYNLSQRHKGSWEFSQTAN